MKILRLSLSPAWCLRVHQCDTLWFSLSQEKITVAIVLMLRKKSSEGRARPLRAILSIKSRKNFKRYFSAIYNFICARGMHRRTAERGVTEA